MDNFIQECITEKIPMIFRLLSGQMIRGRMIHFTETEFMVDRGEVGWVVVNRKNYISFSRDPNPFIKKKKISERRH